MSRNTLRLVTGDKSPHLVEVPRESEVDQLELRVRLLRLEHPVLQLHAVANKNNHKAHTVRRLRPSTIMINQWMLKVSYVFADFQICNNSEKTKRKFSKRRIRQNNPKDLAKNVSFLDNCTLDEETKQLCGKSLISQKVTIAPVP